MMRPIILWLLGICLLAAACQKRKYPEEQVNVGTEDIFFNGYLGSQAIALKVGTNNYYCYSSYRQGTDNVYVFEGELRKFNCSHCPAALRVELTDYVPRLQGASVAADSAFRTGQRNFLSGMSQTSLVRFAAQSNKNIAALHWDFSNGTSLQDTAIIYEFGQPGPQTISLTVRTTNNCESMVVNQVFVSSNGLFACNITAQAIQNNLSAFTPNVIGGKAPYTYTWNFGDGSTSNTATPSHNYQWPGSYPVKLQVQDADGHLCESNYIHIAGNDQSSCTANMLLSFTGTKYSYLNRARIQWTDESNIILRSDSIDQPAESYFEIISSQPYDANERGEPGRLLTLRFNVLLCNGSRKVWFKSDNAAIAVTYK